uniref:tRNA dimethylallyltransferase, mitochondrial n=2 Tax=Lygus hesperus TaxID=30085 RepID=A0A146MCA4_LYGHE
MWNRVPLVVILGPTGVGKTKLSLELAKRFSGEIISADSMQVYKGLDVVTNKATDEERAVAPHHLLDFLDPLKKFTVVHFRNKALPIIRNLQAEKKLPVVVGGTHYYIESLLWDILVEDEDATPADNKVDAVTAQANIDELQGWIDYVSSLKAEKLSPLTRNTQLDAESKIAKIEKWSTECIKEATQSLMSIQESAEVESQTDVERLCDTIAAGVARVRLEVRELLGVVRTELSLRVDGEMKSTQEEINKKLHSKLKDVDAETASVLHHNSRRKILRALQIHASKGVKQSQLVDAQRSKDGGSSHGGPLRFKDAILFWIRCEEDVLDKRLDDRVDDMMNRGLVQELLNFHKSYNEERLKNMDSSAAYTQGIFQSIGFKEFHAYLTLLEEERETELGQKLLNEGVLALKSVTRRYARKQIKWIKNRFIKTIDREVPDMYGLDATDLDTWDENVLNPAVQVVGSCLGLAGYSPTLKPLPREDPVGSVVQRNHCSVCDRIFVDTLQWSVHLKSNKHRRMLTKRKREESREDAGSKSTKIEY